MTGKYQVNRAFVEQIVEKAAQAWQSRSRHNISEKAKRALVDRAVAHHLAVEQELNTGAVTYDDVVKSAIKQIETAAQAAVREREMYVFESVGEDADQVATISEENMIEGMAAKCHWIPWC